MRVLIVEPDTQARTAAQEAVERFGYRASVADAAAAAWSRIVADEPGVVVVPLDADGLTLCRRLRGRPLGEPCYVVVAADPDDEEGLALAMASGADDFLTRPIRPEHLHARLQVAERFGLFTRQLADQRSELDRASQALRASARTDALTHLGNRLQLNDDLDLFQGQLRRYGHRYAVTLVDLDRFQAFNESYGQLAGDEALRVVAATVVQQLRTGDRAYRYGGDALLLLLPEQSHDSAQVVAERLREAVAALAVPHAGNPPWGVLTVSAGVAAFSPAEDVSYDVLVGRAEAALQRAQAAGGNRVACGAPGAPA